MGTKKKEINQQQYEKDEISIQIDLSHFLNKYSSLLYGISILKINNDWEIKPVINGEKYNELLDDTKISSTYKSAFENNISNIEIKIKDFIEKYNDVILGFKVLRINGAWNVWVKSNL